MRKQPQDDTKRWVRELKKAEQRIRGEGCSPLVWDSFFCLRKDKNPQAKYGLEHLAVLDKNGVKDVIGEFFFRVYYEHCKTHILDDTSWLDPVALEYMGLPYDADHAAVKKRFRELAKKHHPDAGGDHKQFVEMMENYEQLMKRPSAASDNDELWDDDF